MYKKGTVGKIKQFRQMKSHLGKKRKVLIRICNLHRLHWKPVILTSYLVFAEEKRLLTFKVTVPRKTHTQAIKKPILKPNRSLKYGIYIPTGDSVYRKKTDADFFYFLNHY